MVSLDSVDFPRMLWFPPTVQRLISDSKLALSVDVGGCKSVSVWWRSGKLCLVDAASLSLSAGMGSRSCGCSLVVKKVNGWTYKEVQQGPSTLMQFDLEAHRHKTIEKPRIMQVHWRCFVGYAAPFTPYDRAM